MHFRLFPLWLAVAALAASCRDGKIASYRVAAEKPDPLPPILTGGAASDTAPASPGGMAGTAVPTAAGPGLAWTAPAHWKPKPASAMRKGSYAVPGENGADADFSVTAFPGDVGGELANFNRWRGQLNLPPLEEAEVQPLIARIEHNGLKFAVVEFVNRSAEKPQRILGALVPYEGATWFLKMIGPDDLVAREKPQFFAFLETVKPSAAPQP